MKGAACVALLNFMLYVLESAEAEVAAQAATIAISARRVRRRKAGGEGMGVLEKRGKEQRGPS